MKTVIAIIAVISCTVIIPTSALYCYTCTKCGTSASVVTNTSCGSQDTCVKYDFGDDYIYKQCGSSTSMCTSSGFKTSLASLYSQLTTAMNTATVDTELAVNLNSKMRKVISCCSDKDYCNNGMQVNLSLMTLLGMALAYVLA